MRRVGVTAALLMFAVLWPGAAAALPLRAKAAGARRASARPGVRELMALRTHRYALIQVTRGARLPSGRLVSRRLGIWRVPSVEASRIGLRLSARGVARVIEPDRVLAPERAAADPVVGLQWWRAPVRAEPVVAPPAGEPGTVSDTG